MYVGEVDKNDDTTSYMYYKINIIAENDVSSRMYIFDWQSNIQQLYLVRGVHFEWNEVQNL